VIFFAFIGAIVVGLVALAFVGALALILWEAVLCAIQAVRFSLLWGKWKWSHLFGVWWWLFTSSGEASCDGVIVPKAFWKPLGVSRF
jgi:hypothetical protein